MKIRIIKRENYLKIEKIAKKELLIRIIIFSTILLYIFFKLYKLSPIFIIIFPILLAFEYVFIIKYLYEVIIINNQKIVVYVSLFYRHLKFCKLFNFLQVYDIDNLKHIYFKNTTEILVIKAIKRTESPYHKIHLTFKDKSYTAFGVKLKDEVAKDIVLTINKFLEKYKKENKIKRLTLAEKENLSKKYSFPLEERYSYILNKILDKENFLMKSKFFILLYSIYLIYVRIYIYKFNLDISLMKKVSLETSFHFLVLYFIILLVKSKEIMILEKEEITIKKFFTFICYQTNKIKVSDIRSIYYETNSLTGKFNIFVDMTKNLKIRTKFKEFEDKIYYFGINLSEEEYKEIIAKILEYNEALNILQGVKNGQYKNTK